ncbi:MAG: bifunctional riboflavin kinase/FAD synthetase [Candidatus Accumulibacter sp.]|jgi:riboflavin kinase/FMN adenylyltransferase|nr:bifunctional riboflavin kinase/FAD synthetase [Accumulibacter sp.]
MLVLRGFSRPVPRATALTIGNFDGVHRGHRALLERLRALAERDGLLPAVLTFEPHPREFFSPQTAPARLSTLREKLEMFAEEGVALACVCRFNASFAALPAREFIARILVDTLKAGALVVGDDFCFGAGREGGFAALRAAGERCGFSVGRVDSVMADGERVSSSAVRAALAAGEMERAARLLGRPYSIDGRVAHGDKLGRQLGFATANLRIKHDNPPLAGVFAVEVRGVGEGEGDGPRQGVANLGVRPSARQAARPLLEVHLFDFCADLYGAHLNVRFVHKLRDERRFPAFSALQAQIARDVESARQYFKL